MTLTFLCRFLPSAGRPSRWWRYWPAQSNSRSSAGPAVRPRAEQTGPGGLKGTAPEAAPTPESRPTWKLGVEVFVITLVYIKYNSWEAGRGPGGAWVWSVRVLYTLSFVYFSIPSFPCLPPLRISRLHGGQHLLHNLYLHDSMRRSICICNIFWRRTERQFPFLFLISEKHKS